MLRHGHAEIDVTPTPAYTSRTGTVGSYRPDIDGLRAVAVLLVVTYHAGMPVRGGYVGVDVFFVISGYLISRILLEHLESGTFSLREFYERRVRRIAPALFAVLLFTSLVAWRILTPGETESYALSQLATLGFAANLYALFSTGSYFADVSHSQLLLHTWSLGVEEQFYLIFPLLLLLAWRLARGRLRLLVAAGAFLAFAASAALLPHHADAAFFLAPLRAWELLLGTALALRSPRTAPLSSRAERWWRHAAGVAGLLLILLPGYLYRSNTPFPAAAALPPCVGAALVLWAGEQGTGIARRLLSLRPLVFVGLVSYSLYLWHRPLLVVQHTGMLPFFHRELGRVGRVAFVLFCIGVAAVSWILVEQPFRSGRLRLKGRPLWLAAGGAFAVFAAASMVALATHGLPGRYPRQAQAIAEFGIHDRHATFREGVCALDQRASFADFQQGACLDSPPGRPTLLLAGDSHAAQMYYGLREALPGVAVLQATMYSCRPLLRQRAQAPPACAGLFGWLFNTWLPAHKPGTLVLAGQWSRQDLVPLGQVVELARQNGVPVAVMGPAIEYNEPLPRLLALSMRYGDALSGIERHRLLEPQRLDAEMAALARDHWHVPYVSFYAELCRPDCPLLAGPGVPLLQDTNHLTPQASLLLARQMVRDGLLPGVAAAGASPPPPQR